MAERDQEKYRAQTEALYAAIGKFAVKFDQMVYSMQSTVITILQLHGLKTPPCNCATRRPDRGSYSENFRQCSDGGARKRRSR